MTRPDRQIRGSQHEAESERKRKRIYLDSVAALYGNARSARIPDNWRDRLPEPAAYYGQHVAKLGKPNGSGYALGLCPFHDDHSPSFGVKLTNGRGHWCCYSGCGKGDMVEFHQRLTGLDFRGAVSDLLEVRR